MRKLLAVLMVAVFTLTPSVALAVEGPKDLGNTEPSSALGSVFGQALSAVVEDIAGEESAEEMAAYSSLVASKAAEATAQIFRENQVNSLLDEALTHVGAPYVYGGTTPSGFDCSGFTSYVFRTALGIELPRTASSQAGLGYEVAMDSLEPGDLLFWGRGSGIYHVGIYVGDGSYVHAAGSGKGVRVQTMDYFHPTFAQRVI